MPPTEPHQRFVDHYFFHPGREAAIALVPKTGDLTVYFCKRRDHDIFAIRLNFNIPETDPEHAVSTLIKECLLRLSVTLLAKSYEVNLLQVLWLRCGLRLKCGVGLPRCLGD